MEGTVKKIHWTKVRLEAKLSSAIGLNGTIIAGAVGAIMQDDFNDAAFSFPISSTYLRTNDGTEVYNYLHKTRYIYTSTDLLQTTIL